ncbi:MAG: glycerate 2-kinase [Blastocatellia bacterium]|nr:glycerate 2-kinase [Blastocatellia bacterium]
MPNLTQLRLAAREIFDETLNAVDPGAAVRRSARLAESQLNVCDTTIDIGNRKIYSVATGKAAFTMAYGLEQVLGDSLTEGFMSGPTSPGSKERPAGKLSNRWRVCEGGHPLPTQKSLTAAKAAFKLLQRANEERALIIFLISGGGSAMLEWPIDDHIDLTDLRSANEALVNCGASIGEINAVRRAFSAVKGGRLAARAPNCDQITLIVSDVPRGEERNVASGPTLEPPDDAPSATAVISEYGLRARLPQTILRAIEASAPSTESASISLRRHFVLLDNHSALEFAAEAARQRGFTLEIASDIVDQPIAEGCRQLFDRLNTLRAQARSKHSNETNAVCLISGGEFACPVRGEGLGGRNLETALRLAAEQRLSSSAPFIALCAGTDGIDGNSPAAGAIVDSTTIERAGTIGLDPQAFLDGSNAYSFFVALGDTIATGATGTNVRDIRILLAGLLS